MFILSLVLFFLCYFSCLKRLKKILYVSVLIFTIVILYVIFGGYFITFTPQFQLNYWVLFFGLLYFYFWFLSFFYLSHFSFNGVLIHSLIMALISFSEIIFPLHPFILLYRHLDIVFPTTHNNFFNLFSLFFLSGILFCNNQLYVKVVSFSIPLLIFFIINNQTKDDYNINLKIAIVQVGLYFEKGGTTNKFFSDLLNFLDNNPGINAVVFSENNFFSYKSTYNKKMSKQLLNDIEKNKMDNKYPLFLSFSGYKDFNNVVTLYKFKGETKINQKKTLIPFVEKPNLLNSENKLESEFFSINKTHKNHNFDIMGSSVSTHICYDALFPDLKYTLSDIVIIQSNYMLLNIGYGFERLQRIATYLAKFVVGIKSKIVINIQNTGGTVVISNGWHVDEKIFEESKNNPFFIIDTTNL